MGDRGRRRDQTPLEEVFRLSCRDAGQAPSQTTLLAEVKYALQANIGWQRILSYLRFLEGSLLLRLVRPLELRLKRVRGPAKLCVVDHGLRASWLEKSIPLDPERLEEAPHLAAEPPVAWRERVEAEARRADEAHWREVLDLRLGEWREEQRRAWESLLVNTEILDGGERHPATVAGLMLFGKSPKRHLPQAGVDAAAYDGPEKDYAARERASLRGPMVVLRAADGATVETGLVEQAVEFVRRNTRVKAKLVDGAQAVAARLEQSAAVDPNPLQGVLFPEMVTVPQARGGRDRGPAQLCPLPPSAPVM
jgi:hypothetical protein